MESPEDYQIRNYFLNNEFNSGGTIDDYVSYIMGVDIKWASIFKMICASIIYSVSIISITNMKGDFMISNKLRSHDFNV